MKPSVRTQTKQHSLKAVEDKLLTTKTHDLLARAKQAQANVETVVTENKRLRAEGRRIMARIEQTQAQIVWLIDHIRRRSPKYYQPLEEAIQAMHGCQAKHLHSFAVRKVSGETILWDGMVEEFALQEHPQASHCYAWWHPVGGLIQSFSLLKLPPVDSPQRAVQMALAAHALGQQLAEEPLHSR